MDLFFYPNTLYLLFLNLKIPMRIFKITLKFIIAIIVLITLVGGLYYNHLKPNYEGSLDLKNISSEATVYFDDYGIPHIYAENEQDLFQGISQRTGSMAFSPEYQNLAKTEQDRILDRVTCDG